MPAYGSRGKKGPPGRAFLTDARRHCLDADLAREYEVDGVDNSNRSMSLGEGAGSSPEALLEAEITRGQVILVPSRVQAPTVGTKNTGVVDRFDAVHYNPDTRGQVHDPVVRVRPGAGDVTKPGLYAAGAVCNRDVCLLQGVEHVALLTVTVVAVTGWTPALLWAGSGVSDRLLEKLAAYEAAKPVKRATPAIC